MPQDTTEYILKNIYIMFYAFYIIPFIRILMQTLHGPQAMTLSALEPEELTGTWRARYGN